MDNTPSTLEGASAKPKKKFTGKHFKRSKRKMFTHKKIPKNRRIPLKVATDPQKTDTEEIATEQVKTEDFDISPPTTPSTLSNTESVDQYKLEELDMKIEDFDMESRVCENECTGESEIRELDVITGDLPETSFETTCNNILRSDLTENSDEPSCDNSNYEPDADISSSTHFWGSPLTQVPNDNSSGSLVVQGNNAEVKSPLTQVLQDSSRSLMIQGKSFEVKSIIILKKKNPPTASNSPPEEVRDPLEINPNEVVNPLLVRDPLLEMSKEATPLSHLLMTVKQRLDFMLYPRWHAIIHLNAIHVFFISHQTNFSIQRKLVFSTNGDVELYVHGQSLPIKPFLGDASQPEPLTFATVYDFVDKIKRIILNIRELQVCSGVTSEKYKANWKSVTQGIIDTNPYDEHSYKETFRSLQCLWLVKRSSVRCSECSKMIRLLKR